MIIYTANFERPDEYDVLCKVRPEWGRFVAFMDIAEPMEMNGWECRPAVFHDAEPRKRARHHKALAHVLFPGEKETCWVDSNLTIGGRPDFSDLDADIISLPHHAGGPGNTWIQEAERCLASKRITGTQAAASSLQNQVDKYAASGLPESAVTPENRVFYRRHNERTERFNMLWWCELDTETIRDQVSFAYARHLSGASLQLMESPLSMISSCRCFSYRKHRPKIYYFSPFDLRGLGWAYNSCCSMAPNSECWVCMMDMDVMLFPASVGMMIEDALMDGGAAYDYLTCLATRILCDYMRLDAATWKERDLVKLYQLAMSRLAGGIHAKPWPHESFAGYFMLFKKKLWEEIPFPVQGTADNKTCSVLGIDTEWARRLKAAGKRIGYLDGLTAVHYYRMGEDHKEHREMLENPVECTKVPAQAEIPKPQPMPTQVRRREGYRPFKGRM